jgi:ABC-2 type transport system permease protein
MVLPILLLLLLSKATSLSVRDIPVVVQDLDKTPMSRRYLEAAGASLSFTLSAAPTDVAPEQLLLRNKARAALVIPPNFERDLIRGRNAEVQWLIDATDANTANVMRGKAAAVTQSFTAQIQSADSRPAIRPQVRYWFNPGREDLKYFGPGVLAFGLAMFPPLLATLLFLARGKETPA